MNRREDGSLDRGGTEADRPAPQETSAEEEALPEGLRLSLTVVDGPDAGRSLEIRTPRVTVGRSPKADLKLNDDAASGLHFAVEISGGEARILDLKTTNGTLVNGEPCDQMVLHTHDEIRAGLTRIVFRVASASLPEGTGSTPRTQPESGAEMSAAAAEALSKIPQGMPADGTVRDGSFDFQPKVGVVRSDTAIFLEIIGGPDKGLSFDLSQPGQYLIGRENGEIPLRDKKCSTKHAQIQILAEQHYYLADLASTNGTFLNEVRTTRRMLKHMDIIRIGGTTLRFSCMSGTVPVAR